MPRRKKAILYAAKGEKELWHPYGLQSLSAEKFTNVVNHILQGNFSLLNMKLQPPVRN